MHTRVFSSFFFISLSLFPLLFRDRRPLPPSQALSPSLSLPFSFCFCVTRTLHRRSSGARALHPLHRDVLSKIQPFFSRADQWALPLPLYPPVPTSPFSLFVTRPVQNFILVSSLRVLSRTISSGPLPVHSRRCSL